MESQYKQYITSSVTSLITSLNSIDQLSLDKVKDEQLIKSFENIRSVISKGISKIKYHLEILSKTAEWDKLNVAFFGETNAGKSTIIEALINGDGRSIGEGYKDFTKTINLYNYNNINLIDMPGIEGRENRVIKNIQKAVNKSHVIFYVIGTNKEPEEYTISKIKNFLKDNAKVYSIINVRDKPTAYKIKKELKDKNIATVESRIERKFSEILGNNYAGNIVVNGYLAFLRSNRIAKTRFENDQIKALNIFGNKSKIEEFSNIREIYNLLDSFKKDIKNEIIISNTYKFIKNISVILSNILREKKNFDLFLKETNELTEKYLDEVEKIIQKYESEIMSTLEVNINSLKAELKKEVNKGIDNGDKESSIRSNLDNIKKLYERKLNEQIEELLSSMKNEIESKIKEFKDRISLQMQFLNFKGNFDLGSILESLEVNFKYVIGQIVDVGLSIWRVVIFFAIKPILGIVAGVLALARKIWDWFFGDPDKRKREAKSKAKYEINYMINDVKKKIEHELKRELIGVEKNIKKPVIQLRNSMKGLKKISMEIDNKIAEIKRTLVTLSTLLMKEILGDSVMFSYLDLQLSEAVVIGYEVNSDVKKHLLKMFRLKEINLYSSYQDWLNDAGNYAENGSFIAKDEFSYRAVSSLALTDIGKIKFQRVERRRSNK